jgi:hypothetical protein
LSPEPGGSVAPPVRERLFYFGNLAYNGGLCRRKSWSFAGRASTT